jgi:phage/plasmid primase-like uncharacterized protein
MLYSGYDVTRLADAIAIACGGKHAGSPCFCPAHNDRHKPSFSVNVGKNGNTVVLHCFAGCSFEAISAALRDMGLWGKAQARMWSPQQSSELDDAQKIEKAAERFCETVEPEGTCTERYLQARGITLPIPAAIRHHHQLWHKKSEARWPAMVAAVTNAEGDFQTIHRTWLSPLKPEKASVDPQKAVYCAFRGCAIHLADWDPVKPLAIAEGIETALSGMQVTGLPTWSAISTGGLKTMRPPDGIREIIIAADNDPPGEAAADYAAWRFGRFGYDVKIARPAAEFKDFNDQLLGRRTMP